MYKNKFYVCVFNVNFIFFMRHVIVFFLTSFDVKYSIHVFVGFILKTSVNGIMDQMGIL